MISEKIVVVDDDPRIHQSLKAVLFEHQLISFLDPQKALDFLSGPNEVNLAMVDVCMKGLNGIELLQRLKGAREDMAVMIITAHGSQDIVVEALRLHADDYIEKPFDVHQLRERVKLILKEKSRYDHCARDPQTQMERIRQFIQRNYTNASLEYIAKEMCLSPQYLGRLFTRYDPYGFRGYKLKVRMEKAMDLLRRSSLDVSEIAYQLGYENPESFMRAFKRQVKKTPGVYRGQYQQRRKKP
ncbi:MAG: response regulator transcription factor [Candidatus Omnitrophica bacterium]|nr:response regulator transcription factor [Candidatus Omnitrophota bacterium]